VGLNSRDAPPPAGGQKVNPETAAIIQLQQQQLLLQQQQMAAAASIPLRDSNNIVTPPPARYLLGPLLAEDVGKKVLVLDLDETLVHSSFKPIPNADFVISIELEGVIHRVYVRKRPGVDHFMRVVGEKFEVVIFTASLSKSVSQAQCSHLLPALRSTRRMLTVFSLFLPVLSFCSGMPILCWTSWTAIALCAHVCSAKHACNTMETTSRISVTSEGGWKTFSSWTIHLSHTCFRSGKTTRNSFCCHGCTLASSFLIHHSLLLCLLLSSPVLSAVSPQPDNAIPITSWFNDKSDRQLYELLPFLDSMLHVDDVAHVLQRRKPAYGSGVGVPPNLLPPGWQPTVQDPDVMNAQQKRGQ
jgi:hypothetical protein